MLLAIDAGNTNICAAVFNNGTLQHVWRAATDATRTADEYAAWLLPLLAFNNLPPAAITKVIMASVVPEIDRALKHLCQQYFKQTPLMANADTVPIAISIPNAAEVGADRLVNAFAVKNKYTLPAVVIDIGTATTFDVITENGGYSGGIIAPGPHLSLQALYQAAAKLPKMPLQRAEKLVGDSTRTAMASGIYWGYIGLIEGIMHRLQATFTNPLTVVVTGGVAPLFLQDLPKNWLYDSDITLAGLAAMWKI